MLDECLLLLFFKAEIYWRMNSGLVVFYLDGFANFSEVFLLVDFLPDSNPHPLRTLFSF